MYTPKVNIKKNHTLFHVIIYISVLLSACSTTYIQPEKIDTIHNYISVPMLYDLMYIDAYSPDIFFFSSDYTVINYNTLSNKLNNSISISFENIKYTQSYRCNQYCLKYITELQYAYMNEYKHPPAAAILGIKTNNFEHSLVLLYTDIGFIVIDPQNMKIIPFDSIDKSSILFIYFT